MRQPSGCGICRNHSLSHIVTPASPFVSHACAIITIINIETQSNSPNSNRKVRAITVWLYRISRFGTTVSHSSDFPFYRLRSNHDDGDVMIQQQQQVQFSLRVARHMVKAPGEFGLPAVERKDLLARLPPFLYIAPLFLFYFAYRCTQYASESELNRQGHVKTSPQWETRIGNLFSPILFFFFFILSQILYCGSAR